MKSVLEVIQSSKAYFEKHGVDHPRLNIEHLLAHTLKMRRMDLYLQFDRPLADAELEPLRDLVRRRANGEPLQHLLGTVEFLGRTFISDARGLIPRPETEQLCELLLEERKADKFKGRVLDVGVGSGVIALTLAAEWPEAEVEAVDVSPDALALAGENAAKLGLSERVKFTRSDLFTETQGKYGLIVANLPYIASEEIPTLSREVRRDPHLALDGGAKGMEIISRLIQEAPARLEGDLALEIGCDQAAAVREELTRHNFRDIRATSDYQGRSRFVFAKHG